MTTLEEIKKIEDWFSSCFKDEEDLPLNELTIKLKKIVIFFTEQTKKVIDLIQHIEQNQATQTATTMFEEKDANEKIKKKRLKKFLKQNSHLKQVETFEECDTIMKFVKEGFFMMSVGSDFKKENLEDGVIFLKNTNPHDGLKSSQNSLRRHAKQYRFPHK